MLYSTARDLYKLFGKYPVISTDTRCIKKDSVFFSLKGSNFNGNEFAETALQNGAAVAIVDEYKYCKDQRFILVKDVLASLQELAKFHRKQLTIPVIGITGTNGKTTTKELVSSVLKKKYRTYTTAGNFNNHIGVPLSVLSIDKDTEIAVIEMGANHPGEIAQLCEIAQPSYGIITNIGKAHLEGFGSFENIISTKKAVYDYVRNIKGKVFVNGDNPLLMQLSDGIDRVIYGSSPDSVCSGKIIENNPFLIINCSAKNKLTTYDLRLKTNIIGSYNFENILAAICIGNYFGVDPDDIKSALENYMPTNLRSQFIETANNKIIMDAYNSNPTSLEVAINNFAELNMQNKIAIIGDMFELGDIAKNEHASILALLKKHKFENVFLVGKEFNAISDIYRSFPDSDAAFKYFKENPLSSKTILIKGSRGVKLEKILDVL